MLRGYINIPADDGRLAAAAGEEKSAKPPIRPETRTKERDSIMTFWICETYQSPTNILRKRLKWRTQ